MKFPTPSLILVIFLAFSCSGNVHYTPSNQEQALSQTRVLLKAHIQGQYDADSKAAAAMFDNDSHFYGEDDAAYMSQNEIQQYYDSLYENFEIKSTAFATSEFNVIGNNAIEIGNVTMTKESKGGESPTTVESKQKYMLLWENDIDASNSWKVKTAMMVDLAM